jgi:Na+-transporting NADH:ubiquinone oxidoreductase subunit C
MWSTLYGLVALDADLNTIAAVTFYEQEETAGLGDQIESPAWQARWVGRRLFGSNGDFRFRIAPGVVDDESPAATHQVDGLSGATITGNAVTALMSFWFGPYGYGPLLERLAAGEY